MVFPADSSFAVRCFVFFALLFSAALCSAGLRGGIEEKEGILPAPSGEAVLLCGESITLNERADRSDADFRGDLEALLSRRGECRALEASWIRRLP